MSWLPEVEAALSRRAQEKGRGPPSTRQRPPNGVDQPWACGMPFAVLAVVLTASPQPPGPLS
jgi:hypothetical protein